MASRSLAGSGGELVGIGRLRLSQLANHLDTHPRVITQCVYGIGG